MDLFTETKMKQWGFSTEVIDLFKEEEIDEFSLYNLTETMVAQLFSKIGQRAKFLKNIEELKSEKNMFNKNSTQNNLNDSDNLKMELSNELITDDRIVKEISLETNTDDCLMIPSNTNIVEPNERSVTTVACSSSNLNLSNTTGVNVKNILIKYQDGEMVLNFYQSKSYLNEAMRNKLISVLIKDQIQNHENLNRYRFIALAKDY